MWASTGFQWRMLLLAYSPGRGAFERRVDDGKIRRFEQAQEDHFEGQFEGQNGASRGSCEPAPACVS
jgi:hypothetical protein